MGKFQIIAVLIITGCQCIGGFERYFTTVTVYTEPKTWNEALAVCRSDGSTLLDITFYSLYISLLDKSQQSPWTEVPVGNSGPIWIGLHRKINLLGEEYYSSQCEALSDFRIVHWNADQPYGEADGSQTGYCVYDEIVETRSKEATAVTHDYTQAECSQKYSYFCQHESQNPCYFEHVPDYYGHTGSEYTPDNDIIILDVTNATCAARCLNASDVYPAEYLNVLEECWGYSLHEGQCILHITVKPTVFDSANRIPSPGSNLYIKQCFATAVNNSVLMTTRDDSPVPGTTCGHLDIGTSALSFQHVTVFAGQHTWNDGFQLCRDLGYQLLHITSRDDYNALKQVAEKYEALLAEGTFWLGLHEPDPVNYPNTRVWANCEVETLTDWQIPPINDVTDINLCAVIDITSNFTWTTRQCSESHQVLCMGTETDTPSYTPEQTGLPGYVSTLGPLHLSRGDCEVMCSNTTYESLDCWAFAYTPDTENSCILYLSQEPAFYDSSQYIANDSYVFKTKMSWSDNLVWDVFSMSIPDESLFPYSCCDVSYLPTQYPVEEPFTFPHDIDSSRCGGDVTSSTSVIPSQSTEMSSTTEYTTLSDDVSWSSDNTPVAYDSTTPITSSSNPSTQTTTTTVSPTSASTSVGTTTKAFSLSASPSTSTGMSTSIAATASTTPPSTETPSESTHETSVIPSQSTEMSSNTEYTTLSDDVSWSSDNTPVAYDSTTTITSSSNPSTQTTTTTVSPTSASTSVGTTTKAFSLSASPSTSTGMSTSIAATASTTPPSTETPSESTHETSSPSTTGNPSTQSMYTFETTFLPSTPVATGTQTTSISSPVATTTAVPVKTTTLAAARNSTFKPRPIYLAPCFCRPENVETLVFEEWETWVANDLVVLVKNTSRYRRTLTSASDKREFSAGIGSTAVFVLVVLGLFLLVMDISTVKQGFLYIHRR